MGIGASEEKQVKLKLASEGVRSYHIYSGFDRRNFVECDSEVDTDGSRFAWYDPNRRWIRIVEPERKPSAFRFSGISLIELGKPDRCNKPNVQATLDRSVVPWILTCYCHREAIKLINNSRYNITILRDNADPLVVPGGSEADSDHLKDVVTYEGAHLNITKLLRVLNSGRIARCVEYTDTNVLFSCTDYHETVIVTVTNKMEK